MKRKNMLSLSSAPAKRDIERSTGKGEATALHESSMLYPKKNGLYDTEVRKSKKLFTEQ